MIALSIARKAFGEAIVLKNIAFQLAQGERLAILGPSGIGKTTLLRIAAGIDTDYSGEVQRPGRLAMVFQEPVLLPWRTARENVQVMTNAAPDAIETAFADFGLQEKESHYPAQLSLGQQRRLSLARAFAANPALLFLDEPFASLDQDRATEMLELSCNLLDRSRTTALLVTHSEAEAERFGGRIVHLDGQPASFTAE